MLQEAEEKNDIIKGSFIDTYRNITLKSLFGIRWMTKYCPTAKYLLKCDDDVIIDFPKVLNILESESKTNTIWGPLTLNAKTRREGKYYLSYSHYPFYYLPPYMRGSGYVMSADTLGPVFKSSEYVPVIPIDDVYITGILGKILNINLSPTDAKKWGKMDATGCDILTGKYIVGIYETAKTMLEVWQVLATGNPSDCPPPKCGFFKRILGKCEQEEIL